VDFKISDIRTNLRKERTRRIGREKEDTEMFFWPVFVKLKVPVLWKLLSNKHSILFFENSISHLFLQLLYVSSEMLYINSSVEDWCILKMLRNN
jgi:hypothetical protein